MDPHVPGLSRRRFLAIVGVGAAGCSSAAVPPATVGDVAAGNVAGLPVGSLRPVAGEPVCIGRDARGVYVMTLTCTHAGCDIGETGTVSAQGLVCGCHGGRFDANGNVLSGPPPSPLDHFDVTADSSGNLTVRSSQIVDSSQRLAVP